MWSKSSESSTAPLPPQGVEGSAASLKKGIWGPRGQHNLRKIQTKNYLTTEAVTASKYTSVSQITENGKATEQNHSLFSAVSWLHSLAWHPFPLVFLI